jgi:hypothetical protein
MEVSNMSTTTINFDLREQALNSVKSKEELDALLQAAMELLEQMAADGASVKVVNGFGLVRPEFVVPVDVDWRVAGVSYVLLVNGWDDYRNAWIGQWDRRTLDFEVPATELLPGARRIMGFNREALYRFLGFNEAFIHPELRENEPQPPTDPNPTHTTIVRRFDSRAWEWKRYEIDWRAVNGGDLVQLAEDLQKLGCDTLECDKDPCNRGISFRDFVQWRGRCPKCGSTRFVVVDAATTIKQFREVILGGL